MFSNPRNFVINNSHFTDQSVNVFSNGLSGVDVLLKASTSEAAYDSSARDPPPRCFPGTREQYIEDIIHWALSSDDQACQPLFWMKGLAGVGKSALAQSCVELLNGLGKPCAAYFFSVNGKMKHGSFFNTVAYQLSIMFPQYRDLVDSKIRRDNTLVEKSMASQFKTLIVEPLQDLEYQGKGIGYRVPIFVDGLDECESQDAQCQIIELIASSARDGGIPLCWAFFSRPERHIEATFARTDISSICYHTILPVSRDADGEIELYLRVSFENVLRECNLPAAPGPPWPSIEDMKVLVDASSGLFVYASTVLRYISHSTSLGPERPLREVLDVILHGQTLTNRGVSVSPFEELDKVYMLIMQRIPSRAIPVVQLLCDILCFCGPLSYGDGRGAAVLGNLLRLSAVEFRTTCQQLSSVLHFQNQGQQLSFRDVDTALPFNYLNPDAISKLCSIVRAQLGGSIAFYHKSFFDFLNDPKRSGTFCVRSTTAENALFEHCFNLRLELEASYVVNGSELMLAIDKQSSAESLSYPFADELTNSVLKTETYALSCTICSGLAGRPLLDPKLREKLRRCDFSKNLCVRASQCGKRGRHPTTYSGCSGYFENIGGSILFRTHPGELRYLESDGFKQMIQQKIEAGALRVCRLSLTKQIRNLLRKPRPDQIESGLCMVGHGRKATYWYWEINREKDYFQTIESLSVAEIERICNEDRLNPEREEEHGKDWIVSQNAKRKI